MAGFSVFRRYGDLYQPDPPGDFIVAMSRDNLIKNDGNWAASAALGSFSVEVPTDDAYSTMEIWMGGAGGGGAGSDTGAVRGGAGGASGQVVNISVLITPAMRGQLLTGQLGAGGTAGSVGGGDGGDGGGSVFNSFNGIAAVLAEGGTGGVLGNPGDGGGTTGTINGWTSWEGAQGGNGGSNGSNGVDGTDSGPSSPVAGGGAGGAADYFGTYPNERPVGGSGNYNRASSNNEQDYNDWNPGGGTVLNPQLTGGGGRGGVDTGFSANDLGEDGYNYGAGGGGGGTIGGSTTFAGGAGSDGWLSVVFRI